MKKILLFVFLQFLRLIASAYPRHQAHMVYLGIHDGVRTKEEIEETHHWYLRYVKQTQEEARNSLIYSYKHSINGFAAHLTQDEASKLSKLKEVVSVFPSRAGDYSLQTTRSWEFAGLNVGGGKLEEGEDMLAKAGYGKDMIVGVIDNGIWPESESFRDDGLGPVPKTWKGVCESGHGFNSSVCNRKLIGARYYIKGYESYYGPLNTSIDSLSPRDMDGHGTHTASTVAGYKVNNVSAIGGFARGMARGGAPLARIAAYKACWSIPGVSKSSENMCFDIDMLAAIDDAIHDGVHVMSISIGTMKPMPFLKDAIAIGSLHAIKYDIVVACSAGNSGPAAATLSNPSPWVMTVGASSVDREFSAPVKLRNGFEIKGQSATPSKLKPTNKLYPLVSAADVVTTQVPKTYTMQCLPGSLSKTKTKGNIVLCLRGYGTRVGKGMEAKRAGAVGFILGNGKANGNEISADAHVLPATDVVSDDALKILAYINSTNNPKATIFPGRTLLHTTPAPFMAAFTSRGPNVIHPHILKPDITAPGLNILAGWSEGDSPTKLENDPRIVKYNILSGTSMSCPHVAALAILLKAINPRWSSAAIRSAIMTTAGLKSNDGSPIKDASGKEADSFQLGAGHFQPKMAQDPGLVYDASYADYLLYLCSVGINNVDPSFGCPSDLDAPSDLNHPSLAVPNYKHGTVIARRTVTNVGSARCSYLAHVESPRGFLIEISPSVLEFDRVGQKRSFSIKVKAVAGIRSGGHAFGWYTLSDGKHIVRSPVVVSAA